MIRLQRAPFDPAAELTAFLARAQNPGGVVSFVGVVRGGEDVDWLEISHYPGFTEKQIGAFVADAEARFSIQELAIVHRYGRLAPGEPIVFVAGAAKHRRAAFEAVDFLMDHLKTDAPFWKKEAGPAGARWIEARPQDLDDRGRWNENVARAVRN
ncbi:MAG: molybdenum cofactor biosynthesis protein MoaE [Pseudomonadota bacterium]|nr:molybdenum cofactor biosynthesis protein MoaE [Pseudomonadota bacterium]